MQRFECCFQAAGYTVLRLVANAPSSDGVNDVISIDDVEKLWESTMAPRIRQASIIVCELVKHAALAFKLLASVTSWPDNGKLCTFIGISSPLVWAQTPRNMVNENLKLSVPHPGIGSEAPEGVNQDVKSCQNPDNDLTESKARSRAEVAAHQNARSVASWRGCDYQQRRAAPGFQAVKQAENMILHRHVPGRVHTAIICPGILYGNGECHEGFLTKFAEAWLGKSVSLSMHGKTANVIPTLHVADLASGVRALASCTLQNRYVLLTDSASDTQHDILRVISTGFGTSVKKELPSHALTAEV